MPIEKCNACGKEVSSTAKNCPHCGHQMHGSYTKIAGWAALAFILLVFVTEKC